MTTVGRHVWRWDGFDDRNILDTTQLLGPDLRVTANVTKGGTTRSATENLDNEPNKVDWLSARINLGASSVEVRVYVNYENESNMSASNLSHLKGLVAEGIRQYWSREVRVVNRMVQVTTTVVERPDHSLDLDMNYATGSFRRSPATGIVDTTLFYNLGHWQNVATADADFKYTAAHELGHSILDETMGTGVSWTHKGTSTVFQTESSSTPSYPASGELDLMYYYTGAQPQDFHSRTIAAEEDVRRLIWLCQVDFDDAR